MCGRFAYTVVAVPRSCCPASSLLYFCQTRSGLSVSRASDSRLLRRYGVSQEEWRRSPAAISLNTQAALHFISERVFLWQWEGLTASPCKLGAVSSTSNKNFLCIRGGANSNSRSAPTAARHAAAPTAGTAVALRPRRSKTKKKKRRTGAAAVYQQLHLLLVL